MREINSSSRPCNFFQHAVCVSGYISHQKSNQILWNNISQVVFFSISLFRDYRQFSTTVSKMYPSVYWIFLQARIYAGYYVYRHVFDLILKIEVFCLSKCKRVSNSLFSGPGMRKASIFVIPNEGLFIEWVFYIPNFLEEFRPVKLNIFKNYFNFSICESVRGE